MITIDQLQAVLGARYRIDRELGQGGMATVCLAEDLKHHRQVAIKVLRHELAVSVGPARFTQEIEIAARLQLSSLARFARCLTFPSLSLQER